MKMSRRKYYQYYVIAILAIGVLISIGAPIVNNYIFHIEKLNMFFSKMLTILIAIVSAIILIITIMYKGTFFKKYRLLNTIEENLISIGAYYETDKYLALSKIRVFDNIIYINLQNIKMRSIIEDYLDIFSTALPDRYIVEDYYITTDNANVVIQYEDLKTYQPESYSILQYRNKILESEALELYFDKRHIVNVSDYPHFLISGSTGSGKSYLVSELVIQAILKGWEVTILDIKRSYGLFKGYSDYVYEKDDILVKLKEIEREMMERMAFLEPELDKNPRVLAVDVGYKPKLVIIEEYISLQSSFEKKQKEELERIVKNISVTARQSNIHLIVVSQSAGTENIQSTTRSNLTKVLLGNAQSNILNATFGNVDIPSVNTKLRKGEGLIQLDRITRLRVPQIDDIDDFKDVIV